MKSFKRIIVGLVISTVLLSNVFSNVRTKAFDSNERIGDIIYLDTHIDDGAPSLLDRDDFISYDDYAYYGKYRVYTIANSSFANNN